MFEHLYSARPSLGARVLSRIARLPVVGTILLLLAALLPGCASLMQPYWEPVEGWRPSAKPEVHHIERGGYLGAVSAETEGFAVRHADGTCDIFIFTDARNPACVEKHEREHCGDNEEHRAKDHPKFHVNLSCQ